jgi:hypothetical protein
MFDGCGDATKGCLHLTAHEVGQHPKQLETFFEGALWVAMTERLDFVVTIQCASHDEKLTYEHLASRRLVPSAIGINFVFSPLPLTRPKPLP